ncbi:hypothetical protein RvY_09596 [Ramazzottius varieornatus]|uniref:Uncharacterized protein n=1 Tax=Ramazzottius varieornatus TaxID=947166 RepID=A0A1D1VHS2_RAMVA|nr:hypothetical protein RvY_09596 [Ramazzottius varieornatus]
MSSCSMGFDSNNLSVAQREAIIARFRGIPDGARIADLLERTLKGKQAAPKKAGKFTSVASKIQIPEKLQTVEEIKRQVNHEIEALSFCRAVTKTLEEREQNKQSQDSDTLLPPTSSISVPFYEQLERTVQVEVDQSKFKIREVEDIFCTSTDWVVAKQKNEMENSAVVIGGDFGPNFAALKDVITEREALRQRNSDDPNTSITKREKELKVVQSRIDFRSKKLLEGGFPLHSFVQQVLLQLNQPQLTIMKEKIGALISASQTSVQDYLSATLAAGSLYDESLAAVGHQRAKSKTLDEELKSLKERAIKDREKIVNQLNKISFGMRLEHGMELIAAAAKREFCDIIFKRFAAEREAREAAEVPSQIDPATGFEIPYCALSETQLEAKVKELHAKLENGWAFMNSFIGHSEVLAEKNQAVLAIELPVKLKEAKTVRQSVESHYQDVQNFVHQESARALQLTANSFVDTAAVQASLVQSAAFLECTGPPEVPGVVLPDLTVLKDAATQASARLMVKNSRVTSLVKKIDTVLDEVVKMSEKESSSSSSNERLFGQLYSAQHPNAPHSNAARGGNRRGRPVTSTPFIMGNSRNMIPPFDLSEVLNLSK